MASYRDPAADWVPTAGQVVPVAWMTDLTGNDEFFYGDVSWTNITVFSGTWAAGNTQPRYSRNGNWVTLQGNVSSGTINTAAFTLPTGYRPSQTVSGGTQTNNTTAGGWAISNAGVFTPIFGSTTNFWISCVFSVL